MRGKEGVYKLKIKKRRITPAYAGKSLAKARNEEDFADHPRVCGEKGGISDPVVIRSGSPPRMRGKEPHSAKVRMGERITPAYAGKRRMKIGLRRGSLDHPRVCGEKFCALNTAHRDEGSPPRMRGKDLERCVKHG